jgi:hypothetical protein
MLVKILGAIDLFAGFILALSILTEIPLYLLIVTGGLVLVKSFMGFPKDFAGWIDFLTGAIIILTAFVVIPPVIKIIFIVLIVQKGISSFL